MNMNEYERIKREPESKDYTAGVSSGFTDLDNMTSGFQPSDYVLIAARPAMGKTAFALNILDHVAIRQNRPAVIFSLEARKEELVNRLLALNSGIDAQAFRSGNLADSERGRLPKTIGRAEQTNIIIEDVPGITVEEMRSRCREIKLERGLDLVIIDYLQLIGGGGCHGNNRRQEVSGISRALKNMARELECPVIILSQLSRAVESRPDKRPRLLDLRETGAVEQDADIVIFIYRDEYYSWETEKKGEAELIVAKQRNGSIGTVELLWDPTTRCFANKPGTPDQERS